MLAEHVEDDTFFTWAVEHDKLYYKAFKAYQKILEKDGQPDEEISSGGRCRNRRRHGHTG